MTFMDQFTPLAGGANGAESIHERPQTVNPMPGRWQLVDSK